VNTAQTALYLVGVNMYQVVLDRLKKQGVKFAANDNISSHVTKEELVIIQAQLADKLQGVLDCLLIDTTNDHNTKDTAHRVAKMFMTEVYAGRYKDAPVITDFPNAKNLDLARTIWSQLLVVVGLGYFLASGLLACLSSTGLLSGLQVARKFKKSLQFKLLTLFRKKLNLWALLLLLKRLICV
jgi:hypothetical protein